MAYRVEIAARAQRNLMDLPRHVLERVDARIRVLADTPRPPGVKKLKGGAGGFRIRVGDYRILYDVDDDKKLVTIGRVLHRGRAYRGL